MATSTLSTHWLWNSLVFVAISPLVACATSSHSEPFVFVTAEGGAAAGDGGSGGAAGAAGPPAAGEGGLAGQAGYAGDPGVGGAAGASGGAAGVAAGAAGAGVGGSGGAGVGGTGGSVGGFGGVGGAASPDCSGCLLTVGSCGSDVVVVGDYNGGDRTVCIEPGAKPFRLVLATYDPAAWHLIGAVSRVSELQVYSHDAPTTVDGTGAVPVSLQLGGSNPANPYDFADSMSKCDAHTGYAGSVHGVAQTQVCHASPGWPASCSDQIKTCIAINP